MIEQIRTWTTRPPGVLDDRNRLIQGEVWRCTQCNIYFQNKFIATEHKCKLKENKSESLN